ncbi:hypothetical protein NMY22_g16333 [Coprinellus aureogranulatus]|nr:hypothetical protein NMY22_g16333 [Coprinellus aureogranulatus]
MEISPPPPELTPEEAELRRLRAVLRPKDIPGVKDWGIPPPPTGPVDEEVASKLATFLSLKTHPTSPKHFNDSLMSSAAFRNPHLYHNLVQWAGVDEKAMCFPKEVWDPKGELEGKGWDVEGLTELQKNRADKEKAVQKKRSHIDFTSSSSSSAQLQGGGHNPYIGGGGVASAKRPGGGARPGTRWGPPPAYDDHRQKRSSGCELT